MPPLRLRARTPLRPLRGQSWVKRVAHKQIQIRRDAWNSEKPWEPRGTVCAQNSRPRHRRLPARRQGPRSRRRPQRPRTCGCRRCLEAAREDLEWSASAFRAQRPDPGISDGCTRPAAEERLKPAADGGAGWAGAGRVEEQKATLGRSPLVASPEREARAWRMGAKRLDPGVSGLGTLSAPHTAGGERRRLNLPH